MKILSVIRTLVETKLRHVISVHAKVRISPHSGTTSDIWSERSMRQSFFCMRQSMMIEAEIAYAAGSNALNKTAGTLLDVAPMLDFAIFTNTKHSVANVAAMKRSVLAKYGVMPRDISLATEDGASNNKAAAKILRQPFKVCFPHDLQRAVLFSTGMTGKPNQNKDLATAIGFMSRMAGAPHRSVKVAGELQAAQIANGTSHSHVLTTSSMNATRWQGLYKMVNRNRRLKKWLALALTGTEGEDMEADEQVCDGDDKEEEEQEQEQEQEQEEEDLHEDDDDEEGMLDADEDEEQVQANEAANKKFPLAHRLLDDVGFKNNSYLESTLFSANEVSGLVQKQEGMGLSMGYQMAKVLKDDATGMKLMVVSGTTKEGDWKETHAAALPNMFKVQRRIFAEQLELRFKVEGTPDKHTLLALKLDPSVNTTREDGIFSQRQAAQLLMGGEYRRRLVRRHKLMVAGVGSAGSSVSGSAGSSSLVPGKRPASGATGGAAKKGPTSVLSRVLVNNTNSGQNAKTARSDADTDNSLDVIKLEEAKYASICVSVLANPKPYMASGIFDLSVFWSGQKSVIPVHYSLWMAEVGCAKVASANVETVFSGAGRISMKSHCLGPQILSDYAFLHYNYKYDWLRPTLEEIVDAYTKLYGKESRESDIESDGSESSTTEEVEEDGDED